MWSRGNDTDQGAEVTVHHTVQYYIHFLGVASIVLCRCFLSQCPFGRIKAFCYISVIAYRVGLVSDILVLELLFLLRFVASTSHFLNKRHAVTKEHHQTCPSAILQLIEF
jgi:hypothetical protein